MEYQEPKNYATCSISMKQYSHLIVFRKNVVNYHVYTGRYNFNRIIFYASCFFCYIYYIGSVRFSIRTHLRLNRILVVNVSV